MISWVSRGSYRAWLGDMDCVRRKEGEEWAETVVCSPLTPFEGRREAGPTRARHPLFPMSRGVSFAEQLNLIVRPNKLRSTGQAASIFLHTTPSRSPSSLPKTPKIPLFLLYPSTKLSRSSVPLAYTCLFRLIYTKSLFSCLISDVRVSHSCIKTFYRTEPTRTLSSLQL